MAEFTSLKQPVNNPMPFEIAQRQIKNTKADILEELRRSFAKKNAVGILIKDTNELITTAVIEIEGDVASDEVIIHLMDHDLHGYPLDRNILLLSNIERVIHFNILFDDPQYVMVRKKEKLKL